MLGWVLQEQDPVSTMQKTGWTIFPLFWSGLVWKTVSPWIRSLRGSQQPFSCVLGHFWHGDDKRTTNQPADPRASLLLTSEKAVVFKGQRGKHSLVASGCINQTVYGLFSHILISCPPQPWTSQPNPYPPPSLWTWPVWPMFQWWSLGHARSGVGRGNRRVAGMTSQLHTCVFAALLLNTLRRHSTVKGARYI